MARALFSREVFFSAAATLVARFPFFGVGPGRFHEFFPDVVRMLQIPLGTWTDNANNYYLSVLSETGLLGFLAVLFFLAHLRPSNTEFGVAARQSLMVLLLLLMVGPHLQFVEVSLLVAVFLASGFTLRRRSWSREGMVLLLCLCIWIPVRGLSSSYGLYPWELNGQGESVRWLAARAQFFMHCGPEKSVSFSVQSLDPQIQERPMTLRVQGSYEAKSYAISNHEPTEIVLSCPGHGTRVGIWSSRMWIPHSSLSNSDYRRLSVQLRPATDRQHLWLY